MSRPGTRHGVLLALMLALVVTGAAQARSYAWLGVRIRDLSEQEMEELATRHGVREGFGVVVVDVIEDAPAAKAGLKGGDIIVALDDRPVTDGRLLQRLVAGASSDREVRVTVLRPEGRRQVPVQLAVMPRPLAGERVAAEFGFVIREPATPSGVLGQLETPPSIVTVLRGTAAEAAGLEAGDVILEVNDRPMGSRDAVGEALADVEAQSPLRLTVRRGSRHVSVVLSPATP